MNLSNLVGKKVFNKSNEVGTIVDVGKYITVEFGAKKSMFQETAFIKGIIRFEEPELQKLVDKEIAHLKKEAAEKDEKVQYGSMKYGPFEVTGKNKQGFYLSELADELALAFVDKAIQYNASDAEFLKFNAKI